MTDEVRIQKALADAGVASRRGADALVADGRVTVNGAPALIGQRVRPGIDDLRVDGRPVGTRQVATYLVLHKPVGVTSTVADRHAARTVVDLVPREHRPPGTRLYPVGRLDRDSEGLILLTNDGDWAHRVAHPSHGVEREYAVALAAPLDAHQVRALVDGIPLDEGTATMRSVRRQTDTETRRLLGLVDRQGGPRATWYRMVLAQGWKRQIRRMLDAVGSPVLRLVRVRIGGLRLTDLRPGDVRALTSTERELVAGTRRDRGGRDQAPANGTGAGTGLRVAIDGPGSSGKSSIGARAASELGYLFCDTGVLYRGLAWLAAHEAAAPTDPDALVALIDRMALAEDTQGRLARVLVDGQDVTDRLHDAAVDRIVSAVARVPEVRTALLPVQRAIAAEASPRGVILAGRDIGSVVLPDADRKLFLDVSL
ncbi:MAG: pseudouridine synthase, partial [Chloroflexi bacterium]|nr:pseudouridine synthase [Chloroflexota bacterium]